MLCASMFVVMTGQTLQAQADDYDTNRGFCHPGGLHTAADFVRIRQQIADNNTKVVSAYNVLKNADYAQSTSTTYPVETIVRGGSGENYINAARGATIAYQNALRWQIDGSTEHARHAVDVLMSWARTTKAISGDSNFALASGLYGYEFAQAAELVRDYEGWETDDFDEFKRWMLNVWYPSCINFLRNRNGTWENSHTWWQCPGHYWSNWGLCNALAVVSIGILCDDVFIYNQGMSFIKYDMVGTFTDPRTESPIKNDGLTEFLGNLVVSTHESELETGAYGKLGQMQESGRDIGHATMAAGLAIDLAQIAWNQGDDLFSYMDNRLAAGIEYVAAQTQSVENLPWDNYHYATSGYYWTDSRAWLQTSPALGEQIRPYWATVIGHYEGVKGVKMPFSEVACEKMGIDGGGTGSTSGGYDHLGYSVLTHTREMATPEQVPTLLTPKMEYDGTTVEHNELGGLRNTYTVEPTTALAKGTVVRLMPQLPSGAVDTGLWEWNTGEKTKDITVTANKSGIWRVTYTNANGVKSQQMFSIAVAGDCTESEFERFVTVNGNETQTDSATVLYGESVLLRVNGKTGWGYYAWDTGQTTSSITLPNVTADRDVTVTFTNQGGRVHSATFHIKVRLARPDIVVNGVTYNDTTSTLVETGDNVTLKAVTSGYPSGATYLWSDGSTGKSLKLDSVQTSGSYSVEVTHVGQTATFLYNVYVKESGYRSYTAGNYYVRHMPTDTYLTNNGESETVSFDAKDDASPLSQQWRIECDESSKLCNMMSLLDSAYVTIFGKMKSSKVKRFFFKGLAGLSNVAILKNSSADNVYWSVGDEGTIGFATAYDGSFPFELVPVTSSGMVAVPRDGRNIVCESYYTLGGALLSAPCKGINIRHIVYADGTVANEKVIVR